MDGETLELAVTAIVELAGGGTLEKKPNVSDVEKVMGMDITANDRDDAWNAYLDRRKSEPEPVSADAPMVKNNTDGRIGIKSVTLGPREARPVPGFDPENGVMKAWIAAKVITVD